MPLQKQQLSLSFNQGINSKIDSKQLPPGQLSLLQNGIFQTAQEIRKRNGFALSSNVTSTSTSITNGNFITTFQNELVVNDSFNTYSFANSTANWVNKGAATIANLSINPVIRNSNQQTQQDSAITSQGLQMFAWEDSSGGVRYSTVDTVTGQVTLNSGLISATGQQPRTVSIAGKLICFYVDTNDNFIHYRYVDGSGLSAAALAVNDNNTTHPNFDAQVAGQQIYLAYNGNSSNLKVTFFDPYFVQGITLTKSELATNTISVTLDAQQNIWVFYHNGTAVKYFVANSNLVTVLAPTVVETGGLTLVKNVTGTVSGTIATVFYDVYNSAVGGFFISANIRYATASLTGTITTPGNFGSGALISKAWTVNTYPHVTALHDSALQPTYVVFNCYNPSAAVSLSNTVSPNNVIAKIQPAQAGTVPPRQMLASINQPNANQFQVALLQKDTFFTSTTSTGTVATYSGTGVISSTLDFSYTNPKSPTLGANLHIGGSVLNMYDGQSVVEHGFHLFCEGTTAVAAGSGGNLSAGQYGYIIVYEWIDNQGQRHQSAPSPALSITTGASDKVTLSPPNLHLTAKTNVNLVIYRTAVNGTVYYRLNAPTSPLANSRLTNINSYQDTAADTTILANEQLYTTGGEVDNIAAPATTQVTTYKNRIVLIPSESPYEWWYSKEVIPGSPVEFSDLFTQNVGTVGGPLTTLAQLDDKLILFKNNIIYFVTGDGPAPSGQNNDFSNAQILTSDAGCIDPQSVVLTPQGLMFKSLKGIYLLDRSLAVSYIGAPVEVYNSNNITSATLISNVNQVRFTLDNQTAIVYDYYFNQWSVFTNINAVSGTNELNNYTYLTPQGRVYTETPGVFNDNGQAIKLKIQTGWLSFAGLQGFQRVYKMLILGSYASPHQLLASISYDYDPTPQQMDYINATGLLQNSLYGADTVYGASTPYGGNFPLYQFRLFFKKQKCEAIQISLEDIQIVQNTQNAQGATVLTAINEGLSLSSIAFEVGMKQGLYKLPANRSFG